MSENIIRMNMGALQSNAQANANTVICLGIESSCDETSAAIVDSERNILSHIIYSQIPEHQKYGGVVPELAARAHILAIDTVIQQTLAAAGKTINDIDVIAATAGPGLIGGVLVGWMAATGIAQSLGCNRHCTIVKQTSCCCKSFRGTCVGATFIRNCGKWHW